MLQHANVIPNNLLPQLVSQRYPKFQKKSSQQQPAPLSQERPYLYASQPKSHKRYLRTNQHQQRTPDILLAYNAPSKKPAGMLLPQQYHH